MHNTGQVVSGVTGVNDMDCNALEAWDITTGSEDIIVAVIDDGLEAHEDLVDDNGVSRIIGGYTPSINGNGTPNSSGAHGVACAGSIAASHNNIGVMGVAPKVKLLSVNIFYGGESSEDIANGITWAKENGADVLSNSWGSSSCAANFPNISFALADANENGRNGKGCVITFAGGNEFNNCISAPGNHPDVIAVGAFTNQGQRSNYSNYGPSLDIVAPSDGAAGVFTTDRMGSAGYTTFNYTGDFGGTSSACPVVSGVCALILSVNPNLTSDQVKDILYSTATDMGPTGFDVEYGNGRVNAHGAVLAALGDSSPTCDDGIQNGNETGIDCGGTDCPDCSVNPTCNDGVQNGDETGVDCGGSDCTDCPVLPTCNDGVQNGDETGVDCGGSDCPACQTGCSENEVELNITFDQYPAEISWSIYDENGNVFANASSYGSQYANNTVTEEICLPDGCYTFQMTDSYGDGICCNYGNGSLELNYSGTSYTSAGNFGSSAVHLFGLNSNCGPIETCDDGIQNGDETGVDCGGADCPDCPVLPTCDDGIQNGNETGVDCGGTDCPDCSSQCADPFILNIILDAYPEEISWDFTDSNNDIVASSNGTLGSEADESTYIEEICLPDGCYTFTLRDSYGDGICCGTTPISNGSFTLSHSNAVILSGGDFGSSISVNTCDDTPPTDGLLLGSYFENGWDSWIDGGDDCIRSGSAYAPEGSWSIKLRDDNGEESSLTSPTFDLSNSAGVIIGFSSVSVGLEDGDGFELLYSLDNGLNWFLLESYLKGDDYQNEELNQVSLTIPSDSFTFETKFRFMSISNANADVVYLDEITISQIIADDFNGSNEGAYFKTGFSEFLDQKNNFSIIPNPATDHVIISSQSAFNAITIHTIDGRMVYGNTNNSSMTHRIDLSVLEAGIYLVSIKTGSEIQTKRLVVTQ